MKTEHNGTQIDALRAHRIYDMLHRRLRVRPEFREQFVVAAGRGDSLIHIPVTGSEWEIVFINQHAVWAVGADPDLCTIDGLEELYAVTASLKAFVLAHYLSGAPGPEFNADIQKAHGADDEKDKSTVGQ